MMVPFSSQMACPGLVLVLVCLCATVFAAPEYQFSFGKITGVDEQAQDTLRPYYAYYGIPFAAPPVGSLRFRAPRPFFNRNDPNRVISSNRFRAVCMQTNFPASEQSEDCLHLNVFTPTSVNDVTNGLKKVMVWIHGGGFVTGSARDYMPSRMVTDYDVIVVLVQYRLGVLGFLNPGGETETNFGLRDQIMGIRWVKDNIRQFGGDPDDITIFGESAGSTSVSLLTLSPLSKGLFTRAIMQSGVATSQFLVDEKSEDRFLMTANYMGCASWLQQIKYIRDAFKDDILDCLRSKIAGDFYRVPAPNNDDVGKKFDIGEATYDLLMGDDGSAPSIDGVVIPKSPEILLADRNYLQANGVLDRSYMMGFNNAEGLLALIFFSMAPGGSGRLGYEVFSEQAVSYVKNFARTKFTQPVTDDVMDFVEYQYTYPRGDDGKPDVMNVLSIFNDVLYTVPTVEFARSITSLSPSTPVYLYLFDHYPELIDPSGPLKGSTHGMELNYEFDKTSATELLYDFYARAHTQTDQPLYNIVRNSWTQFAKTGRPSSQEYSSWPRFDPQKEFYLALSTKPEVKQRLFGKVVDLWTKVIPKRAGQSFRSRGLRLY